MKRYIFYYLIFINILSFAAMGIDKLKAIHHKYRISEKTLFLLSAAGGSIGTLSGMYLFRHKTKHRSFNVGVPAILVIQFIAFLFTYFKFYI